MLENKAWFQEFRPSKFEDLIFPNEVIAGHFNRFKEMGYIDGNILMYSNGGFGKTSTIGVFVRSIIQNENDIYITRLGTQIAIAVPVQLGYIIAESIKEHLKKYNLWIPPLRSTSR